MDFEAFQKVIKEKKWTSVYLLCGDENHYVQQAEKMLINALLTNDEQELNLLQFNGVFHWSEFVQAIESIPFFGDKKVILIKQCSWFSGENPYEKELVEIFSQLDESCQVIFTLSEKVDKRKKLYKWIQKNGLVMEADALKLRELRPWLEQEFNKHQIDLTWEAKEYFFASLALMPQVSLSFLEQELLKLSLYKPGEKLNKVDLTEILASLPEISIFALVEAMSKQELVQAFRLLEEQLSAGVHELRILALMARQIRLLLEMKALRRQGVSPKDAAGILKIHPYGAEKLSEQCSAFAQEQLEEALLLLAETDGKVKNSQNVIGLERVLLCLCQKK